MKDEPVQTASESTPLVDESEQPSPQSTPTSDSVHTISESQTQRVDPIKPRQSNHYWFVDAIGKFNILFSF